MKATLKCAFLLIVAYLVAATLAAVPHYDRRDTKLPYGAYWQDENTVVLPPDAVEDISAATDDDFSTIDDDSANMTTAILGKRAAHNFAPDEWRVDIRTGGPKQHAGTLRKKRIYKFVHECMVQLGTPYDGTKCKEGPEFCKDVSPCCDLECVYRNVVYDSGGGTYATNSNVYMRVWWAEIYDNAHKGLRDAAYDLVAKIYQVSTETEENCYYVDFKDSRRTKMCNVPRHVFIIIPSNGADRNIEARLNVIFEWNGRTIHGEYYCDKNLPAYTKYFKENTKEKISKVMNWKSDKIFLYNSCQEDKCFDTRHGEFKLGRPFVELRGCNPPRTSE